LRFNHQRHAALGAHFQAAGNGFTDVGQGFVALKFLGPGQPAGFAISNIQAATRIGIKEYGDLPSTQCGPTHFTCTR
jgi:hypothetical protein